jgi:hypothetical protein
VYFAGHSIIFSLIERAQFKLNAVVYQSDAIAVPMYERHTGKRASFLEYYLRESEQMHGKVRIHYINLRFWVLMKLVGFLQWRMEGTPNELCASVQTAGVL